jgi:hypothetical protein
MTRVTASNGSVSVRANKYKLTKTASPLRGLQDADHREGAGEDASGGGWQEHVDYDSNGGGGSSSELGQKLEASRAVLEPAHRLISTLDVVMILIDRVIIRHNFGRRHRHSVRADLPAVFSGDRDRGVGSP